MASTETLYTEGELMTLHNAYHHQQYTQALTHNLTQTSTPAVLPARVLQLRAQIALGQQKEVLSSIRGEEDTPALAAVQALALYTSGSTEKGLAAAQTLATEHSDDDTVQVLAGTILAAAGQIDEAISLVSKHNGTLEAVALSTQLHLLSNRPELAEREVSVAKKWAQDSLLVNIAESWIGLRVGGERYQQAFYEFEEMPIAQSVAEIHLGRLPEAETGLRGFLDAEEGQGAEEAKAAATANLVVVETLAGRSEKADELLDQLKGLAPEYPLLVDLQEKSSAFDDAATKYSPKVAATA